MPNTVICGNCGAEVIIPEHGEIVTGMTIGRCDGNSTFVLPTTTASDARLEQLRAAGVDVSNYFSVSSSVGDMVARRDNEGNIALIDVDDIESNIIDNGYIRNTRLHRRWVMAQMFSALNSGNYNTWLHQHGYNYQWKATLNELYVLSKLEATGDDSFYERSMFFNRDVVVAMLEDYIEKLKKVVDNKPIKKHRGMKYKRINNHMDIYINNMNIDLYNHLQERIDKIKDLEYPTYRRLYRRLRSFLLDEHFVKLNKDTNMCSEFITAYKGNGAYYTLKNMILYHGVVITDYETGETYNCAGSYDYIKRMNEKYKGEGWRMFALLKKTIADNNFSFGN